jgi:uncharacterized protein YdgA (DUF945 family)
MDLKAPGIVVKSPEASFSLEGLEASSNVHLEFGALSVGKLQLGIEHLAIDAPAKDFKLNSQNLTLQSSTSVSGDFLNGQGAFTADSLDTGKFAATQLVMDVRLDHIHGPSLASLTKDMRAAQAEQIDATLKSGPADAPTLEQQQQQTTQKVAAALQTYGPQILGHEPVIEFPHIGCKTPDGDVMLSIKLAVPGITPADMSAGVNALMTVVPKYLQATLNARIDTTLLEKLMQQSATDPDKVNAFKAQLQQLQNQGYVKADGNALTTQVTFIGGQLKVNGLPFVPPMQQPPQQQGKVPPGRRPLPGPSPRRVPH